MNIKEYDKRQQELYDQYVKDKRWLAQEFALSHSSVKKGDFVTDHIGTVKVESFQLHSADVPSMIYIGTEYTKAGKPSKKDNKRAAYQCNLLKEK